MEQMLRSRLLLVFSYVKYPYNDVIGEQTKQNNNTYTLVKQSDTIQIKLRLTKHDTTIISHSAYVSETVSVTRPHPSTKDL